ncbi:hypothetical protein EI94DRAFT_1598659 [Lactarius quietus]|nr:hypothetical protein EI94DRAFT_1598659 [Lactarius quietus]
MPRCSKDSKHKKSSRLQLEKLYRKCRYCNTNRPTNRFDKHQKACKTKWAILQERKTSNVTHLLTEMGAETLFHGHRIQSNESDFVQGSSTTLVDAVDDLPMLSPSMTGPNDFSTEQIGHVPTDLRLPPEYIKIVPHPHSRDHTVRIIPLTTSSKVMPTFQPKPNSCPWAPFKTLADFEYTETALKGLLSKELVNAQLAGIHSTWAAGSYLSIKSHRDMENVLAKARKYFVQPRQITFEYRDPWKWILALIQDESLAPWNMWNSIKKFYCCGDVEDRMYDEPNTGDGWWEVDVGCLIFYSLPTLTRNSPILRMSLRMRLLGSPTAIFRCIFGWTKVLSHAA